jgi:ABC-2 type transport system ATP-binding protein
MPENINGSPFALETNGLSKKFGSFTAVRELNLKIKRGEVYGLLGPNGAGKTTAIKLMCGLLEKSDGKISVLGKEVPDKSVAPRIGYMPQEMALYVGLTVHENIAFFGEIYGLSHRDIKRREKELLSFIGLEKWRDSLVANLSGGMKHRVSLVCTLVHEPELLFLDEPTVGVDPELRASFWEYFGSLREKGITILITTHYMDEAQHCGRIGMMRNGALIAEGTPSELMQETGAKSLEDTFLHYSRKNKNGKMNAESSDCIDSNGSADAAPGRPHEEEGA